MLERYIRTRLREKPVLLMTHLVLGYPSLEDGMEIVDAMIGEGVDIIELQFPFSEPVADGPVIARANHAALDRGAGFDECLDCGAEMASSHGVPFLAMTYYNLVFRRGEGRFAADLARRGFAGAIVPDLPLEEGSGYLEAMKGEGLSPVLFFSPSTGDARMRKIAGLGSGLVYCVAREGVTGEGTSFAAAAEEYLVRCRAAADLPLAAGFGVSSHPDVEFLAGKADIAVVGTGALTALEDGGIPGLRMFLRGLRLS